MLNNCVMVLYNILYFTFYALYIFDSTDVLCNTWDCEIGLY